MTVIAIDKDICTGCQECVKVCPATAIEGNPREPQTILEDRCVMCGRCVQKCKAYISLIDHGADMYTRKRAERGLPESVTEPLFAAYNGSHIREVTDALDSSAVFTMVQAAPAVRVALAEDFGFPLGTLSPGKLAAALRALGFDRVYDTDFAADLTIMEEGTELVKRITEGGVLPMFTSCCPAWVRYIENNYPQLTHHLSSCKSPQQMLGAVFKSYGAKINNIDPKNIYSVSIMPCTCKGSESARPEMNSSGCRDVDVVLTTRELAYLIKSRGIDWAALEETPFDMPLGEYTGAGVIFGVTGGVMEAALRTGYMLVTGKEIDNIDITPVRGSEGFRLAEIKIGDLSLKAGVVTGLENVEPVLKSLADGTLDCHFIEVMTCPEGCISGGGQPKLLVDMDAPEAWYKRRKSLYDHDKTLPLRKSHENPNIKKLYHDYLKEPYSHEAHHLLHTHYKGSGSAAHTGAGE